METDGAAAAAPERALELAIKSEEAESQRVKIEHERELPLTVKSETETLRVKSEADVKPLILVKEEPKDETVDVPLGQTRNASTDSHKRYEWAYGIKDEPVDAPFQADEEDDIDGPGPYTFFCWADGISTLLDVQVDNPYLTLKSSVLALFKRVAHLSEEERDEVIWDDLHTVKKWYVILDEAAQTGRGYTKLVNMWKRCSSKAKTADEGDEKEGDKGDDGWWYEVTLQRDAPKKDAPGLKFALEDMGDWWMTAVRATNDEGAQAMTLLVDYLVTE